MKKFLSFAMVAGVLFMFGCTKSGPISTDTNSGATATTEQNNVRETYENTKKGFALQIPSTRTVQENVFEADVVFFSPLSKGDTVKENVSLLVKNIDKTFTAKEYYEMTKPDIIKSMSGFTEIKNENMTINGVDAQKIIYTSTQGELTIQREQVYVVQNNISYIFTYTALDSTFNDFAQIVEEMISTREIK